MIQQSTNATCRRYVCASEFIKLIGSLDGRFPDFGHHQEREMGGLWMHPIKLLDGFWLRFHDLSADNVNTWISADSFTNYPYANQMEYSGGLGHTSFTIRRFQYAPEEVHGLIVEYAFTNHSTQEREIELELLVRTDLRPVWFSEEIGVVDGTSDQIEYLDKIHAFHAKDCDHEWHTVFGCDGDPISVRSGDFFACDITSGNGVSGSMTFRQVVPGEDSFTLRFFVSGSCHSVEDAVAEYQQLKDCETWLAKKRARYEQIDSRCMLQAKDAQLEEVFRWVKYNTDWLIVNSDDYGRAIAAGIPEYTWWFGCDSFYALQGVLALGDIQLCRDTLELILHYSEKYNGNGRIVHEITTIGACSNPGNTQETAHFVTMVWKYYEWTGDRAFLERAFDYMKKSVEWLQTQDDDHDYFPGGYGIIEIAGLNMEMIDSAVYTCEAYDCFAKICSLLGKTQLSCEYGELASNAAEAFQNVFWNEEQGLYCDAVTSYDVVRAKLDAILEKTPNHMKAEVSAYMNRVFEEKKDLGDRESGWLLNRNWVINTPMEIGLAPKQCADRALKTLHTDEYIGEYGMYLNAMYHDATMTISTGVMAVAQAQYGYADRTLELLKKMFRSFSLVCPGSMAEMSPDYGCFVQAWTTYAVMVPVVRHFFGIQPDAANNRIIFAPCMPQTYTQLSLENVPVLDGAISVFYQLENGIPQYRVRNTSSAAVEVHCEDAIVTLI